MIEVKEVGKSFGAIDAVRTVSFQIAQAHVFGLIGTNGAGKSTLLRMMAGVLKPDEGMILVDGMCVYGNVNAKQRLFFIADEPYFFSNAAPRDMERYYSSVYSGFNRQAFYLYLSDFGLDSRRKIHTFSKGMKKQLAILCGICAETPYLFCDETFDGLDPVMRQSVKGILAQEMDRRGLTPVIASHNLRELEDMCDHVGLLHNGGVLLSKELEDMKLNIQKVQCVFHTPDGIQAVLDKLEVLKDDRRGNLHTLTVRGTYEETAFVMNAAQPLFFEALPLSLEEIFISETEVAGYDIKKIILG